jgi:glycosyltransferase involved in cell wall biosynthesis
VLLTLQASASGQVLAVCPHPLNAEAVRILTARYGSAPRQLLIRDLRAQGSWAMLRRIRAMKASMLLLICSDDSLRALVPVMQVLSLAFRVGRVDVVWPDLTSETVSRLDALTAGLRLVRAMLHGRRSMTLCRRELAGLADAARIPLVPGRTRTVLYLKAVPFGSMKVGGSAAHTAGVVGGLIDAGYGFAYASNEEPPESIAAAVAIHPVPALQTLVPPLSAVGSAVEVNLYRQHRTMADACRRLTQSTPAAFIYQRYSLGNYAGVMASRASGLPLVLEYNGSEVWLSENWANGLAFPDLARAVETACLRHAHVVVTISDVLKEDLLARGVEAERIVTAPNGVDPVAFDPRRFGADAIGALRQRWDIPADGVVICFIGTFGQWHGIEVLARAIRFLAEERADWLGRHRVYFTLIGDGLLRPEVEAILDHPVCRKVARLTGTVPQTDAPLALATADIFASPHVPNADGTRFFGSPTKLFEYLAMARPVVASALDQIGDILADCPHVGQTAALDTPPAEGQCGLLVTPGSVAELAEAIRLLVENRDWREAAGVRARELVNRRYTWRHHVDQVLARLGVG